MPTPEVKAELNKMRAEIDNFVVYMQRYIETQLLWVSRQCKMPYKTLEDRYEAMEWVIRVTEFVSSEEQQKFLL